MGNTGLIQFSFTSNSLTAVVFAGLDTGANQSCTTAGFPNYAPAPDERYYALGIGSATAANNGEIIGATSGTGGQQLKELQFVSSTMQVTPPNNDKPQLGTNASPVSPLTEFYNTQVFTVTGVTASTIVVTVTANNTLAANDLITLSGVAANPGNNCTAGDIAVINGGIQTVASATATNFTFDATIPTATTGGGCTVTGATATGGPDYLFLGVNENPAAAYTLLLPSSLLVASGDTPVITGNEHHRRSWRDKQHDRGQRFHRRAGVEHLFRHAGDVNHHLRNHCRVLRGQANPGRIGVVRTSCSPGVLTNGDPLHTNDSSDAKPTQSLSDAAGAPRWGDADKLGCAE